jgi:hypothetical protein
MENKFLLTFIILMMVISPISAKITLDDFSASYSENFCINSSDIISIYPEDENDSFSAIDGLWIHIEPSINLSYKTIKAYTNASSYSLPIIFSFANQTNYVLSINISQSGKVISKDFNISITECKDSSNGKIFNKANLFIINNWQYLVAYLAIIIIILLIIKITTTKKHE